MAYLRLRNTYTLYYWDGERYCQCLPPFQKQVPGFCVGGDMSILNSATRMRNYSYNLVISGKIESTQK